MSHFQYNVLKEEFYNLFKILSNIDNINFVFKPHTRNRIAGVDKKLLDNCYNAELIPSMMLSKWADVGIVFGSSIGFQLLIDDVTIIVPSFVHTNSTIYEKYDVAITATNEEELADYLLKSPVELSSRVDHQKIDHFIKKIIYGNQSYDDMMTSYVNEIINH